MKTITIQDATANDLQTALAGTAPIPNPNPNPTPSPTVTAPFQVDRNNPLAVLVNSPDGPILMVSYDVNTKVTWLYIRSYLVGDTAHGIYPGAFLSFQCPNNAGAIGGAVTWNGGYIDGTPGKEQGSLDAVFPVDGAQANISFVGRYTPVGGGVTYPPALACWPPDLFKLGTAINRFDGGGFKILPVRPGMPAGAVGCIDVGGKFVPVYP